jgi:CHAD domain-containing protein
MDIDTLKTAVAPVETDDTMAEAGRKILLADFVGMLENEAGSREGEDSEFVHHMRVATRRMRSAFRTLTPYYKPKAVQPFTRHLRKLARRLGKVRDLDVLIENLERELPKIEDEFMEGAQILVEKLNSERRRARKKLISLLDSEGYHEFLKAFSTFLTSPGKGAISVDHDSIVPYQVRHVLPGLIHEHLARVRAYDTVFNPNSAHAEDDDETEFASASIPHAETLHALRIEFKRLRYITSHFADVLGASGEKFIEEIKTVQDHLGRLNDLVVAQARLRRLLVRSGMDESVLGDYLSTLAQEQSALEGKFLAVWSRFNKRSVQSQLSNALLVLH